MIVYGHTEERYSDYLALYISQVDIYNYYLYITIIIDIDIYISWWLVGQNHRENNQPTTNQSRSMTPMCHRLACLLQRLM